MARLTPAAAAARVVGCCTRLVSRQLLVARLGRAARGLEASRWHREVNRMVAGGVPCSAVHTVWVRSLRSSPSLVHACDCHALQAAAESFVLRVG